MLSLKLLGDMIDVKNYNTAHDWQCHFLYELGTNNILVSTGTRPL